MSTNKASNRERIVETALALFNAHGVGAVTTNQIAEAAGVSPGNLYYHFRNKQEIIREFFPRIELALKAGFDFPKAWPLSPERMVKDYVDGIALLWDYRFFFGALVDLVRSDNEIADFYARIEDWSLEAMTDFYLKLIRDGQMSLPGSRARVADLARKTVTLWFSIVSFLRMRRADEEIARADIIDGGLQCFFDIEPYLEEEFARPIRRKLEAMRRAAKETAEEAPAPKRAGARI
ncbi:MAG TPA: TetR family transcriptional regulator [Parvibaculum sp.]